MTFPVNTLDGVRAGRYHAFFAALRSLQRSMKPEIFDIPFIHFGVKGYGFMLMVGFLTGIWWAARRATRVKANPDLILNLGFVALIFGVIGARAFYVIHYWGRNFAGRGIGAILDVTAGGMEFYGGFLGALVFLIWYVAAHGRPLVSRVLAGFWIAITVVLLILVNAAFQPRPPTTRSLVLGAASLALGFYVVRAVWRWGRDVGTGQPASLRMYLDIMTPSLMWGLAFGRIGCFLNGCCWGATCTETRLPWAVRFPVGSPAQVDQWVSRQATLPAQLIYVDPRTGLGYPIPRELLTMSPEKRLAADHEYRKAQEELDELTRSGASSDRIALARKRLAEAEKNRERKAQEQMPLRYNLRFYDLKPSDLEHLARRAESRSVPVHPTQLYASVNAFLLAFLLNAVFYRRRRHGVVFGLLWILYPVARIVEEAIRADNPLDTGGLTISQAVSVGGLIFAAIWFAWLYRQPLRSPRAVAYVPPEASVAKASR